MQAWVSSCMTWGNSGSCVAVEILHVKQLGWCLTLRNITGKVSHDVLIVERIATEADPGSLGLIP